MEIGTNDLGLSTGSLDSADLGLARPEGLSPQLLPGREGQDEQNFEQAFLRGGPSVRSSEEFGTDPGTSLPSQHPSPVARGMEPAEAREAALQMEQPFAQQQSMHPNLGKLAEPPRQGVASQVAPRVLIEGSRPQDNEPHDLAAAIHGPGQQLQVPKSIIPSSQTYDVDMPVESREANASSRKVLSQQPQLHGQGPSLQQQPALVGRGASVEQQALLESWKNVRDGMWQAVDDVSPSIGNPATRPVNQQGVIVQPPAVHVQPPAVYVPVPASVPGPFMAQVTPLPEGANLGDRITVMPERAGTPPAGQSAVAPQHAKVAPARQTVEARPQPAEEPSDRLSEPVLQTFPHISRTPHHSDLQRDFQYKLQTMHTQLVPELQARRQDLQGAVQSTECQIAEVRRRCLEAFHEGQADFEALKAHLSSVEDLKMAVLNRERTERLRLVEGIDDVIRRVDAASLGCHSPEVQKKFVNEFPELQASAQSMWSRAAALPQVEVGIGDIPFEARAKSDKLRKFAVMSRLQQAKDVCLWRVEQHRRQLANEILEATGYVQHLETLLDRYAEEFSYVCYFCNERFAPSIANTRCLHNGSHLQRAAILDHRIPGHAYATGLHFWVHCSQSSLPRVTVDGLDMPRGRLGIEDMYEVASVHTGSRQSTPPRMFRDAPFGGPATPASAMPWSTGFAPLGGHSSALSTDALLRKIAQAFDRCGADVRSGFRQFDANGDGFISPQEFRQALLRLRIPISDEEIVHLISRLDTNADGMVSYEEFLANHYRAALDPRVAHVGEAFIDQVASHDVAAHSLWQRVARAFRDRGVPLRQVFALFDWDGDGIISWQEMLQAFRLMHLGLSESDVERLMRDIDVNEDGKVSVQEFVNRLQSQ